MPKSKAQLAEERRETGQIVSQTNIFMDMDCSEGTSTWNSDKIFVEPAATSWSMKAELKGNSEFLLWLTLSAPKSQAITSNFWFNLEIPGLFETKRFNFLNSKIYPIAVDKTKVAAMVKNHKLQLSFILRIKYAGHPRLRQKVYNPNVHKDTSLENLRSMLDNPVLADFKFIVRGKEFKIHKNVLAAASPMLLKMFTIDMAENKEGESRIDHIEPEAFEAMLKFVYGGEISENCDARQLYSAAHFFEIDALKNVCEQEVHSSLNFMNALEIFAWAHHYDELEALKFDAWDVIKSKILMKLGTHDLETNNLDGVKKIVDAALAVKKVIAEFKENLGDDEEDSDHSVIDEEPL